MIDVIKNGSKILSKIFDDFGVDEITDIKVLDKFLERLLFDTKGLVIVDFLDSGNWDHFGSYSIDYKNEILFLNWHQFKGSSEITSYLSKIDYKPKIITLMLHFKELKIEKHSKFPFITLRGYSIKEKEVFKYFKKIDRNTTMINGEEDNFRTLYKLDRGNYIEECYCHNTPIYSILIIPKDTAGSGKDSMKILFLYNYQNCLVRIQKVEKSIQKLILDEDELCEKANTIRRIFEFVLKIECCFHLHLNFEVIFDKNIEDQHFVFNSSYSEIRIGELAKILKQVKNEKEIQDLNTITQLSNELSHDSGKKVFKEKVLDLTTKAKNYTERIILKVKEI